MDFPNIFTDTVRDTLVSRILSLQIDTNPAWGKMTVDQMLAHCCVPYEFIFENIHPRPGVIKRLLLRTFVKPSVVSNKPYKRNAPTASTFKIVGRKNFQKEQKRLINYLTKCVDLGAEGIVKIDYPNFGKLTVNEWNNLFYKHLDHHLVQFGV